MLQNAAHLQHFKNFAHGLTAPAERTRARQAWGYYGRLYHDRYGSLFAAVMAAIAQSLALLPLPVLVSYLIDRAVAARSIKLVLLAATGVFGALIAYAIFAFLTRHFAYRANSSAVFRLRTDLLSQLFRLPRSFYASADHGKLHANVVQDSERVVFMGSILIEQFLPGLLTCIALTSFLFWLDLRIVPVIALIGFLLFVSIRTWERRVSRSVNDFRMAAKNFSYGVTRLLRSVDLIRQRGADKCERDQQNSNAQKLHDATLRLSLANSSYNWVQSVIIAGAMLLVLSVSGMAVVSGRMTLGQLLAVYATFALIRDRLYVLLQTIPLIVAGNQSLIATWQMLQLRDYEPYTGTRKLNFAGQVAFRSVSFGYNDRDVVTDITCTLEPGEVTAIVGPNAAGKTTLTYLLLGFYQPRAGHIEMDGVQLDQLDLQYLRRQIGVVPQDPQILPGTIAQNISYGFPEMSASQIEFAARLAGLHEFVITLPDLYDHHVGEGATLLSGGQRQRLAIARALATNPKLLVLDEPTNHLDAMAIDRLLLTLNQLETAPAILLITHDLNVASFAGSIYEMENGTLALRHSRQHGSRRDPRPEAAHLRGVTVERNTATAQ
ncbi:MAG TPA: ABC transporter ATP-binding protein [Pyrinomonadaceae bacterium]|jgi:ABC-type bacteriocin/lantibiotic exporter with double-glycine peptidase domain|nr:ABC transporter ATP-binding protein [Pyrinomonadaceae bacterium]